ncbi:MAG: 50S ribosomal protein L11 methyltransferase, partial [Beijerinckiaceae bacterium]
MREGLLPSQPTHVMRLATDMATAMRLGSQLGEMLDAEENAVAAFESSDETHWLVEVFFSRPPDETLLRELVIIALGPDRGTRAAADATFDHLAPKDWIAASLDGLKPVRAGRFLIHGSHDRTQVRSNDIAIEIEAALAFGTGHHGTTLGCLQLLVSILKRRRPRAILDVGTGTGVLAIAAALALKHTAVAGDIDPVSTWTARNNATANGAGAFVRPVTSPGLRHPSLARAGGYDLIFANILAKPLRLLARSITGAATTDAELVLSGLLKGDVAGVLAAYRGQGFHLAHRVDIDGWVALLL